METKDITPSASSFTPDETADYGRENRTLPNSLTSPILITQSITIIRP